MTNQTNVVTYEWLKTQYERIRKDERNRILKELEQIAQHNWEEIETDEGEMVRMCFCGELIGKIEDLRGEP